MNPQNGNSATTMPRVDFDRAPFLVIWESTRSCALACQHCRASAILRRDPWELNTEEGMRLLDQTAELGTPVFIISGGDPLNRTDIEELVRHGKTRGLRMGTIPAATSNLTKERLASLREAGLDQVAFSLDGPLAHLHDNFRGTAGSYAKTLQGVAWARELGMPVQINTCFAAWNYQHLDAMIELVKSLGIVFWEVFFLVPMGRGEGLDCVTPAQFEEAFAKLHDLSRERRFIVKVTEAQHYRRFVIAKELVRVEASTAEERIKQVLATKGVMGGLGLSPKAVNSGNGFMFVDHVGNVCPSGFLPIPVANARTTSLVDAYRNSTLFRELRNPKLLKGRCGRCEFASVCGGSRARAYAATGDYLAEDPSCGYQPAS